MKFGTGSLVIDIIKCVKFLGNWFMGFDSVLDKFRLCRLTQAVAVNRIFPVQRTCDLLTSSAQINCSVRQRYDDDYDASEIVVNLRVLCDGRAISTLGQQQLGMSVEERVANR